MPPAPEPADGSQGLKRHPALIALSRDHHFALVHALSLRRAAEASPGTLMAGAASVAEAFLSFYDDELHPHMTDEEVALLPAAEPVDPENVQRVRAEHDDLYEKVALLRLALAEGGNLRELMKALGDRLHDHVRFEERVLFESLQALLTDEVLAGVGRAIEEHREKRGLRPGCRLPT